MIKYSRIEKIKIYVKARATCAHCNSSQSDRRKGSSLNDL